MAKQGNSAGGKRSGLGGRASNLFSFSTLAGIPSNLTTLRKFMSSVNWKVAQEEIESELRRQVALVGLANSGKSTLFNTLQGRYVSPVSSTAGTTTTLVRGELGPFSLIDTPGHLPDVQQSAIDEASLIVYLIDASKGIRQRDMEIIQQLHQAAKPFVVALNKSDLLGTGADEAAANAAARLKVQDVIPISAQSGENVAEELLPAMIEASPEAAMVLGRQLPGFRRTAANKLVRTAALVSLAAGLEPIPLVDIPILLGTQIRMVLRIAAVYGEPPNAEYLRELAATVAGGLLMRYLAEEAAKIVPIGGDLVSGAIAAAGTWAIGQVAIEYFEGGKQLNRRQLNDLFGRYYRRYREEHPAKEALPATTTGASPKLPAPDAPASRSTTTIHPER